MIHELPDQQKYIFKDLEQQEINVKSLVQLFVHCTNIKIIIKDRLDIFSHKVLNDLEKKLTKVPVAAVKKKHHY